MKDKEQKLLIEISLLLHAIRDELKTINKYNHTFAAIQGGILGTIFAITYMIKNL
jgi:hypothetical protein